MHKENGIYIFNYWWAANYGANLTAFALQSIIPDSELVNNAEFAQEIYERKWCFHKNFEKKYLKTIKKSDELLNSSSGTFITGSDQVFRLSLNPFVSSDYFLDFVKQDCKKIAFSASFGVDKEKFLEETPKEAISEMKNSLKTFDFISVREKSGVEICRDLFDINAEWIIDPVFILDKSKYEELIKNSTKDYSNKIVSYILDTKKEYKKAYKYLSKKYNKDVVEIADSDISIENWLNAIKTCELLVTDSFHGMSFAIIFNKPCICIINSKTGSTRYESVFEKLEIENQCIKSINEIYTKDCVFKYDYEKVSKKIEEEQEKGLAFLKKALETPTKDTQEKNDLREKYLKNHIKELEEQNSLRFKIKQLLRMYYLIILARVPKPVQKIMEFMLKVIKRGK